MDLTPGEVGRNGSGGNQMDILWIVVIVLVLAATIAGVTYKACTGSCPINRFRRKK